MDREFLTPSGLSYNKKSVISLNFISIDTNTIYIQEYKDIAGIYGQK